MSYKDFRPGNYAMFGYVETGDSQVPYILPINEHNLSAPTTYPSGLESDTTPASVQLDLSWLTGFGYEIFLQIEEMALYRIANRPYTGIQLINNTFRFFRFEDSTKLYFPPIEPLTGVHELQNLFFYYEREMLLLPYHITEEINPFDYFDDIGW